MKLIRSTNAVKMLMVVLGIILLGNGCASMKKNEKASGLVKMVFIKGGCFDMGDIYGEGSIDEKPVHNVCIDDFFMSETEVIQDLWEDIMGNNPSEFKGGSRPVENVSWDDVQEFLKKLNEKTGVNYRLPTEAEWEFAAREGGWKIKYATGKDTLSHDDANYFLKGGNDKWVEETSPIRSFPPNALGLYDMGGNVWEWCSDWFDEEYYKNSPKNNPKGPSSGKGKVVRGGSWWIQDGRVSQEYLRSTNRCWFEPYARDADKGFRLVIDSD